MLAVTSKFITTELRRMGQLHMASCCQGILHLARVGSSGTSKETSSQIRRQQLVKHSPDFRGGSGEPGLPLGWLRVFVALMETKEPQNDNKTKGRRKKGRGKIGKRLWEKSRMTYAVLNEFCGCLHSPCSLFSLRVSS